MTVVQSHFKIEYTQKELLQTAARAALETALNVQPYERVLIMSNPDGDLPLIATALYNATLELLAHPVVLFQPARSRVDLSDPATIAAIASEPDVLFTVTRESLGNDPIGLKTPYRLGTQSLNHIFYYLIASKRARGAWSPSADIDTFCRTVPIDYPLMWLRAKRLKHLFDVAIAVHITTPAGTDLHIDLFERPGMLDDGDYRFAGTGGNIPAGEVFTVPNRESHGVAVIDGSAALLGGTLRVVEPIRLTFTEGKLVRIEGGQEAEAFRATMSEMTAATECQIEKGVISPKQARDYMDNAVNLAELGIGLNPAAMIVGNMTEDEKVLDTCHIAVGDDCYGYAPAVAHLDLIMKSPSFEFTLRDGRSLPVDPLNPPEVDGTD